MCLRKELKRKKKSEEKLRGSTAVLCVFGFIISGQTNACTISRNRDLAEIPPPPISIFIRGEITKEFRSFWTRKLASENLVPPLRSFIRSWINRKESGRFFVLRVQIVLFFFSKRINTEENIKKKKKRSAPRDGWPPPSPVTSSSNYTTKNPLKIPPPLFLYPAFLAQSLLP